MMKKLLRLGLFAVGLALLLVLVAFAVGATLPVDHSVSITGTVSAPPDKVFAQILNIAAAPTWRPEVKSVQVLPKDNGRDNWIEDLGHGVTMKFVAITTAPPKLDEHGIRKVDLKDPSYGGAWTYDVSPGPTSNTTTLKITEDGYINPPLYRFMMKYLFGPTKNLNDYLHHMENVAPKL